MHDAPIGIDLPADCGGPFDLTPENTITCWENNPTTLGELSILSYCKSCPRIIDRKSLLHIGIGNGQLFAELREHLVSYVGLTISIPEIRHFHAKFPLERKAAVLLANKYDPRAYPRVPGTFDLIVDGNLKSYMCCERHFQTLMRFYRERLSSGGRIITDETGLNFGWSFRAAIASTPGANTHPMAAASRVLGIEGLRCVAEQHGFSLQSKLIRGVEHRHGTPERRNAISDNTIWILKRG